MEKSYCYICMKELEDKTMVKCPHCGSPIHPDTPNHQLRPGTVLQGEYLVGCALGEGGFGITYIGRDLNLDTTVAIKEYFPIGYSSRNSELTSNVTISRTESDNYYEIGKERFLSEARILAKLGNVPGVVTVKHFFEANNTAYFVMEYLGRTDLKRYVKEKGTIPSKELFKMFRPVIQVLGRIHAEGIIHRDISPDNIMLMNDGTLKLLDFGAARQVEVNKSMSVLLKHGYAPIEQYSIHGNQGSWTDVYALCATMYYCLTGKRPQDAVERLGKDKLKAPSVLGANCDARQETALMRGLAVHREERYQSMIELERAIYGEIEAADMWVCRKCGFSNSADYIYCVNCGSPKAKPDNRSLAFIGSALAVLALLFFLVIERFQA